MTKFLSKDGKFYMQNGKLLRPTNILEVPVTSNLTYNGKAQSPTIYGYDENTMTIGGVTSGTNVGNYIVTFTPKNGYQRTDGSSDTKNVNWTIAKAAGSLSLSTNSLTIDANSTTASFTVTRAGDGAISATSSAPDIAAVSVSGNTVTVTKKAVGTATITVTMAETAFYSGASATCVVGCRSTTGALPVGSNVYLNVDGVKQRFIVVHQGNPNTSLYDSSCTGTWLMMENQIDNRLWNSSNWNNYASSDIHAYLNGTALSKFDSGIQSAIKQVKIPYGYGYGSSYVYSGANGLSAKLFLLSLKEMGYSNSNAPEDGVKLDYFKSGGNINGGWTRTPYYTDRGPNGEYMVYVQNSGYYNASPVYRTGIDDRPVKPTLILPSDMTINELGFVVASGT